MLIALRAAPQPPDLPIHPDGLPIMTAVHGLMLRVGPAYSFSAVVYPHCHPIAGTQG